MQSINILFMAPIPLEENLNWWWYKAKKNLLLHIIENNKKSNNLKILEIGPGLGNNLETLNNHGSVDVLETETEFISHLEKFKSKKILNIYTNLEEIKLKYDLIILLDVLEHIEKSKAFMTKVSKLLNNHGTVIVGVPAYQKLWSKHDEQLLHFRRYNWDMLKSDCSNFKIVERYGHNYLLLPIRYIQIKLNRVTTINENGKVLNNLLYMVTLIEVFLRKIKINPKFGLALYVKLKKNDQLSQI